MALAKSRLQARIAERRGLVSVEVMTGAELSELAGDKRVIRWLNDPGFAAWLTDRDTFVHTAVSLKDAALQVLEDILLGDYDPKCLTAKDKLKAADMLFQLTGAYPKANQVRFLDRELDGMEEAEVDRLLTARGIDPVTIKP
jgi:hypothetical protein